MQKHYLTIAFLLFFFIWFAQPLEAQTLSTPPTTTTTKTSTQVKSKSTPFLKFDAKPKKSDKLIIPPSSKSTSTQDTLLLQDNALQTVPIQTQLISPLEDKITKLSPSGGSSDKNPVIVPYPIDPLLKTVEPQPRPQVLKGFRVGEEPEWKSHKQILQLYQQYYQQYGHQNSQK